MKPNLRFWALAGLFLLAGCHKISVEDKDYRHEMRLLVEEISAWAKDRQSGFYVIPQNGVELLTTDGEPDGPPATEYIDALDGIGQEELFYGYTADNRPTPPEVTEYLSAFLDLAKQSGRTILVTDYCSTPARIDSSYMLNRAKGYISFAADSRELDRIPAYPLPPFNANDDTITSLSQVRNFLYLINPDNRFPDKQSFIRAVQSTDYDLLITDLFFDGRAFTAGETKALRQKANGGRRLVIAYMSIGEAEDYRYYWQSDWRPGNPSFIVTENPDWPGNYIVRYWDPAWKQILFGNDSSYLKKILYAGFDGVYLDIIDAYEYFEN